MLGSEDVEVLVGEERSGRVVLDFYDVTCPFCYLGQRRTEELVSRGLGVVALPFQAHPEVPPEGVEVGVRRGPMYERIEREARGAGLPLRWQAKLPNSRAALAAAEWTRQNQHETFDGYLRSLFAAHFADGLDVSDLSVILRLAAEQGIGVAGLGDALADGNAMAGVTRAEAVGRRLGVTGTPAWASGGHLIIGLRPAEEFERFGRSDRSRSEGF